MNIQDRHKVFISYHHANDQMYKEYLAQSGVFIDMSVDTGGIDENLSDQDIRQKIRDEYLQDSSVTIVLVGTETRNRKHVDWEIYSSMYDGKVNKKSGILVINLPTIENIFYWRVGHGDEEKRLYPSGTRWGYITTREEYQRLHPCMPSRIIDNLLKNEARISITDWYTSTNDFNKLKILIDLAYRDRLSCDYDLSTPMQRKNF